MDNIFFDLTKLKYLGEGCIIGKTVRIRHPERCIIGDGTIIDDFTYISCGIDIGKHCHIASHVSISGGEGKFIMGDYSTISNHCSLHCASSDYAKISLDLPSVPKEIQFGGVVNNIVAGKLVVVGAHSCVLPGAVLCDGFACGAFSLIKGEYHRPYTLYVGIPAKEYKKREGPIPDL